MNKMLKTLTFRDSITNFLPSLILSLVLAEQLFKFGSFTLECLAFFGAWWIISGAMEYLSGLQKPG